MGNNDLTIIIPSLFLNSMLREQDRDEVIMEEIRTWLKCRIHGISLRSLNDRFHRKFEAAMQQYYTCAGNRTGVTPDMVKRTKLTNSTINAECLRHVEEKCDNASLRAIKFIRLRMRHVAKLLPFYPNMKIIHLNRDPRGIMNSRFDLQLYRAHHSFPDTLNDMCKSVYSDLKIVKSLVKYFPDRVKFVLYEELAEEPLKIAKEIYQFIGIDYTEATENFILASTSSTTDSCKFCTSRKNSSSTASHWRGSMRMAAVTAVQRACRQSNAILGFLDFHGEAQLRDLSLPSRAKKSIGESVVNS